MKSDMDTWSKSADTNLKTFKLFDSLVLDHESPHGKSKRIGYTFRPLISDGLSDYGNDTCA